MLYLYLYVVTIERKKKRKRRKDNDVFIGLFLLVKDIFPLCFFVFLNISARFSLIIRKKILKQEWEFFSCGGILCMPGKKILSGCSHSENNDFFYLQLFLCSSMILTCILS